MIRDEGEHLDRKIKFALWEKEFSRELIALRIDDPKLMNFSNECYGIDSNVDRFKDMLGDYELQHQKIIRFKEEEAELDTLNAEMENRFKRISG